jgi:hypothetical protein
VVVTNIKKEVDIDMNERNMISLPIQRDITSYLNVAYAITLIKSKPLLNGWYHENFINVYAQTWFSTFFRIDYLDSSRYFGDILDRHSYTISDLKATINIIDFISDSIDNGFVLNVFTLDEYYISESPSYNQNHFIHEILVNGYDHTTKELNVLGYNKAGLFTSFTYTYDEFNEAFNSAISMAPENLAEALHKIRVSHIHMEYPFNLERFLIELHNFIFSKPDDKKAYFSLANKIETAFGLDAFRKMLSTINETIDDKNEGNVNFISFHFLSEHRKGLYQRFMYIVDLFDVQDLLSDLKEYSLIVDKYEIIRLMYLRQALKERETSASRMIVKDKLILKKISDKLTESLEEEYTLLLRIYNNLQSVNKSKGYVKYFV